MRVTVDCGSMQHDLPEASQEAETNRAREQLFAFSALQFLRLVTLGGTNAFLHLDADPHHCHYC